VKFKCIIHLQSIKSRDLKAFTEMTWSKFKIYGHQWSKLDGNDRILAERNSRIQGKGLGRAESKNTMYVMPCNL